MSKPYTRIFWKTLISWRYHKIFLSARFKSNFIDVPPYRRLMSLTYALVTIGCLFVTQDWQSYLVAFVIPITLFYQMSALAQFSTEHLWGSNDLDDSTKSHARFCGEIPPTSNSIKDWSWWWLKMLAYHLPARIAILSSELVTHDVHHILPKEDKADWCNLIYLRQRLVEDGLIKSKEHWGIHNAAKAVFQNLAEQDPLTPEEIDQILKD